LKENDKRGKTKDSLKGNEENKMQRAKLTGKEVCEW
jgi:hypothetical protein